MDLIFVSTRKGEKEPNDGGRKGMATVVTEAWLASSWAGQRQSYPRSLWKPPQSYGYPSNNNNRKK